jgi:signal peptidase II
VLDLVAFIALLVLAVMFLTRHHSLSSQIAFGLIVGGIAGNLTDRILPGRHAVVDFIYFYLQQRGGDEIGFPAFNVADTAICTGVGLIFLITWRDEHAPKSADSSAAK